MTFSFVRIPLVRGVLDITSYDTVCHSPRFLCRPTALYMFARAVGRQRAIHTENS